MLRLKVARRPENHAKHVRPRMHLPNSVKTSCHLRTISAFGRVVYRSATSLNKVIALRVSRSLCLAVCLSVVHRLCIMFPALQPSRPKVSRRIALLEIPPRNQLDSPQYPPSQTTQRPSFQQTRPVSNDTSKPMSQIEAMPPNTSDPPQAVSYNPATRHPVFFSASFHKPPFSLPLVPSSGFHPSATGYVFNSNKSTPPTKL